MRILVLGGTAWLGREVAAVAVAAGHEVVCVARGSAGDVAPGATLVVADRDRDDALADVAGERWDAVLDVARQPGHVRRSVRDLADRADHYVFVSSISAYQPATGPGLDESAPLRDPLAADVMESLETYGEAKVACENAVLDGFAGRSTIARAGLIGGPGDWSDRTTYWPHRFHAPARDGLVLVPDAPDQPTSLVDARDLGAWLLLCLEQQVDGVFDASGRVVTLAEHLAVAAQVAAEVTGFVGSTVPAGETWLTDQGVGPWSGPRSLPLWLTGEDRWLTGRRSEAAFAAGLAARPLADTLRDALAWRRTDPDRPWGAGLEVQEERVLLAALT